MAATVSHYYVFAAVLVPGASCGESRRMGEHTGQCRRKESVCKTERHCGVGESAYSGAVELLLLMIVEFVNHKFNFSKHKVL